jgi:hypothetical protein
MYTPLHPAQWNGNTNKVISSKELRLIHGQWVLVEKIID